MSDVTYTLSDLVDEVERRGLPRPGRRAADGWVRMGLIDQPHRKGMGRGREPRRWSEEQAMLFVALHQAMRSLPRTRVRELVNVPLYIWIKDGDAIIPLRQVRRALRTLFEIPRHTSRTALRSAIARYVERFRGLGSSAVDRRALVEAMVRARGRQLKTGQHDTEMLRPHLEAVLGEQVIGPDSLAFGVDIYIDRLVRMDQVAARLQKDPNTDKHAYTDEQLAAARDACSVAFEEYRAHWPQLARRADIGALFGEWTVWTEMRQSGQLIATVLGAMFEPGLRPEAASRSAPGMVKDSPRAAPTSAPEAMLGAWRKWLRAQSRLAELRAVTAQLATGQTEPPVTRVRQHVDVQTSELVVSVEEVPPVPEEAPFLAGEVAHHLRGALNYLVRELAWVDTRGGADADHFQTFPILTDPRRWNTDAVQKVALRGLNRGHLAMIERLQPYRARTDRRGNPHPLEVLQAFTNDDKYRRAPRLRHRLAYLGQPIGLDQPGHHCHVDLAKLEATPREAWEAILTRDLTVDSELFRLPLVIDGPDPEISVGIEALTFVAMGSGLSLVQSLSGIATMVAQILREFEAEFDGPVARRVWRERDTNVDALPPPPVTGLGAA
jgi:hypothetical protein